MTTSDVDVVTGEVVPVNSFVPALSFAYSPEETGAWMRKLQDYRRAVLEEESDYGVIPGTKKPTLYKAGAEKLLLAAGLGFTILKVDDEDARTHQGVTYRVTIRRGAQIVAECDGYAGYDEDRFYVSQAGAEAKERATAKRYNRPPDTRKFAEYRAPWNSVIKMAQKRAYVGATLNALAASALFTQDLEDEAPAQREAANQRDNRQQPRPQPQAQARPVAAQNRPAVAPAPAIARPAPAPQAAAKPAPQPAAAPQAAPTPQASPQPAAAPQAAVTFVNAATAADLQHTIDGLPDQAKFKFGCWRADAGLPEHPADWTYPDMDRAVPVLASLAETGQTAPAPTAEEIAAMSYRQLAEACADRDLPTNGTQEALRARLLEALAAA